MMPGPHRHAKASAAVDDHGRRFSNLHGVNNIRNSSMMLKGSAVRRHGCQQVWPGVPGTKRFFFRSQHYRSQRQQPSTQHLAAG